MMIGDATKFDDWSGGPISGGTTTTTTTTTTSTTAGPTTTTTTTTAAPGQYLGNGGFESALAGSAGYDNWFASGVAGGSFTADRFASATMDGSYVGRLSATGGWDDIETTGITSYGSFVQGIRGNDIRASSLFSLKVRPTTNGGSGIAYLQVIAYDVGSNVINDQTAGMQAIKIFGTMANIGANTDVTSLIISTPSMGTNYTRSFDLKTWLGTRMNSGKYLTDIEYVNATLICLSSDDSGTTAAYFDTVSLT
jgi:hypothetical protein